MSLTVTVVPGYLPQDGELITNAILRQLALPTINISGALGTALIPDNSVTTAKLVDGVLSADTLGRGKMADAFLTLAKINAGIFTADANGRAPFATGWLNLALIANGIFLATTAGRAPFAAGLITAALSQPDAYGYGVATGTASAYVVTFTPALSAYASPTITTYMEGMEVVLKAPATCATGVTMNAGLGVKGIYRIDGTALQAGDILVNTTVTLRYNTSLNSAAGGWQLQTPVVVNSLFYRAGGITLVSTAPTLVAFSTPLADANYRVAFGFNNANNAEFPRISNKTAAGFTLTQQGDTAGATNQWDWIAVPNN